MALAYLWASLLTWSQNSEVGDKQERECLCLLLPVVVLVFLLENSSGWSEIFEELRLHHAEGSERLHSAVETQKPGEKFDFLMDTEAALCGHG